MYIIFLSIESQELLRHETETLEESANDPVTFSEGGIELVKIGDQEKDQIKCFLCAKGFNSNLILEQHFLEVHDADETILKEFMKARSKRAGTCF